MTKRKTDDQPPPAGNPLEESGQWVRAEQIQVGDVILYPGWNAPLRVGKVSRCSAPLCATVSGMRIPRPGTNETEATVQFDTTSGEYVFLAHRPQRYTGRYWIGWYTQVGTRQTNFPEWRVGATLHKKPWFVCAGDVRAANPVEAFNVVLKEYPDAILRGCSERSLGWVPGDRCLDVKSKKTTPTPDTEAP